MEDPNPPAPKKVTRLLHWESEKVAYPAYPLLKDKEEEQVIFPDNPLWEVHPLEVHPPDPTAVIKRYAGPEHPEVGYAKTDWYC